VALLTCAICGKSAGMTANKLAGCNGYLCRKCLKAAGGLGAWMQIRINASINNPPILLLYCNRTDLMQNNLVVLFSYQSNQLDKYLFYILSNHFHLIVLH